MSNPRASVFASIRKELPAIWNDAGNVLAMDNLLDAFGFPRADNKRRIGPKGIALIKQFEGCHKVRSDGRIEAYPDPGTGNVPITIGWGTTLIDGKPFKLGTIITQAEADRLLENDLEKYADEVSKAIGHAPTSQEQFDSLVSFHYNTGAIGRATLTKLHRAGDFAGAEREFGKWNKAGGRVMKGLTRRRAEEAALYRSGS